MAKKERAAEPEQGLVLEVLNDFLHKLEVDPEVGVDVAARLRKALVEMQETSPEAIRRSLFPDNTPL